MSVRWKSIAAPRPGVTNRCDCWALRTRSNAPACLLCVSAFQTCSRDQSGSRTAILFMAYQEKQLQEISKQFQIYGEILHAETFKIGHINETYSATYNQGGMRVRYIHQKINKNVFKNPPAVMQNVMRVTTHIRKGLEAQNARD